MRAEADWMARRRARAERRMVDVGKIFVCFGWSRLVELLANSSC